MLDKRYQNLIVCGEGLVEETPELLDEVPELPGDGWDTLKRKYLLWDTAQPSLASALAAYFPRGNQLDGLNMWITDAGGRKLAPGHFLVELTARGILSARGYKISTSAAVATQSAENVIAPAYDGSGAPIGGVLRPKIEIAENQVTCDVTYLSLGVGPRTHLTGRAATPPNAPTPPTSWWDWLDDPVYHEPNGWVLMASDGEGLPNVLHSEVCLITDRYQFIYEISP